MYTSFLFLKGLTSALAVFACTCGCATRLVPPPPVIFHQGQKQLDWPSLLSIKTTGDKSYTSVTNKSSWFLKKLIQQGYVKQSGHDSITERAWMKAQSQKGVTLLVPIIIRECIPAVRANSSDLSCCPVLLSVFLTLQANQLARPLKTKTHAL